ncbi:MAG TPA: hypothetical protein VMX13_16195 [Sedimentisphaerales bacterium]|nr:hypothetical protein [Sedimentisphaerales bacterium]
MHSDHDVFAQAIQLRRKIQLAFFTEKQGYESRLCVPLGYKPDTTDDQGCYCFWEPQGRPGERPLTLSADEIAVMQLSEDTYDPADLPTLDSQEFAWLFKPPRQYAGRNRLRK